MLGLVIFAILLPTFIAMEEDYYRRRDGYLLLGPGGSNPECVWSDRVITRPHCAVLCTSDPACDSVNYREADGCCVLNNGQLYDFGVKYEENPLWTYYGPDNQEVSSDEWTLVFKAASGTGTFIWDAWTQPGVSHDLNLTNQHPGYFSKYSTSSSYPFYRSHWLDNWPAGVKEVKLGLYVSGTEVLYMTFDGTGSTRDDWFSYSRVLHQPWDDLHVLSPAIFSLEGDKFRKFYITLAGSLANCDNFGWLIVLNRQANMCDFDKEAPPPQFLYSGDKAGTYFKYKLYELADVLAVFVKF